DNQFPHSIAPGDPLGMTAFKILTIDIDPLTDRDRYWIMQGYNYRTMVMDAYDETGDVFPNDKRFVMSSGPFNMAAGDSAGTCVGVMCAWDRPTLLSRSDVAQEIYNNNFQLAMAPTPPSLAAYPGNNYVRLVWNKAAETNPDPYYAMIDPTKRWYTYFKGSWKHCKDTLLVDSLLIKTSPATVAAIARGAANPPGGTDTMEAFYNQQAMYSPYDFQGYALFRARALSDLSDPAKRQQIGQMHYDTTSGAQSLNWDKRDGYQIVIDIRKIYYATPSSVETLDVYDTLGADCGLAYTYADYAPNGDAGYYYGLSAFDFQPNVYFTRKCPTTLSTLPIENAVFAKPKPDTTGALPPGVYVRVDRESDARSGGALNYLQNLFVADPAHLFTDSFKIRWAPVTKVISGSYRLPQYRGYLYNALNQLCDSTMIMPDVYYDSACYFYGKPYDQLLFGGIVFQPVLKAHQRITKVDSFSLIENSGGARIYPKDSCFVRLDPNTYRENIAMWMWRGSDFDIRWKDTIVNISGVDTAALTCRVWDLTNNVEVPFEGGLAKGNMTKSAWCFNPSSTVTTNILSYIYNRNNADNLAIFICGVTVYFNKWGTVTNRMKWADRPETGDVWRIYCSGQATPGQGEVATFTTTPTLTTYPTVMAPNGGERWAAGYPHAIRWRKTGSVFNSYRIRHSCGGIIAAGLPTVDIAYLWNVPAGFIAYGGKISVEMVDGAGVVVASDASDNTFDLVRPYPVWPGDCTNGGVVNAYDVLRIGRFWNHTGPARDSVSTAWEAKNVVPWSPNADASFADCDGNGVVNIQDVLAIGTNWHKTHTFKSPPSDEQLPDDQTIARNIDNYRAIYSQLQGDGEAVREMKAVLLAAINWCGPGIFTNYMAAIRPNPVRTGCVLEFGLEKAGRASLKIYNIMGQRVATLADGEFAPGNYRYAWNAANTGGKRLSAGVYLCRLQAAGYTKIQKITVLR
ncbi:MAG: T9SS type A sorting domain-containing protein, partial [Candidatus Edwardsbacteria bacterium]|nr:T9SS type A sorting domain-containing protein [Candidatus Edwardsbacteria bacterium]